MKATPQDLIRFLEAVSPCEIVQDLPRPARL